jgi:hypothetical protein
MARTPKKVEDGARVDRVIPIPGWVYNELIDVAEGQHRDVKSQIVFELEQVARRLRRDRERKEQQPGNSELLPLAA